MEGEPSGMVSPGPRARGPNRKSAPLWEAVRMATSTSLIHCKADRDQESQNVNAPKTQASAMLPMMVFTLIFCRLPVTQAMKATRKKPASEIKR